MTIAPASAITTAHRVHDSGAGEVDSTVTKTPVDTALGEPTTAPNPVGIETVRQRDPEAVQTEVLPRPTFRHGTGRNRRGGIHENHHEERTAPMTAHIADTRRSRNQPVRSHQSVGKRSGSFSRRVNRCADAQPFVQNRQTWTERWIPTRRHRTVPPVAPANRKAVNPKRQAAQRINHQVHRRRVRTIFRAAQDRFRPS